MQFFSSKNRVHPFHRSHNPRRRTVPSEHHQRAWTYHCHPNCLHSCPSISPQKRVRNLYREKTPPNIELVLRNMAFRTTWASLLIGLGYIPGGNRGISEPTTNNSITILNFRSWFWPEKWTTQIWTQKKSGVMIPVGEWWGPDFTEFVLFHLHFVYELKPKILGQNGSG